MGPLKQRFAASRRKTPVRLFGQRLAPAGALDARPDHEQADVRWIRKALQNSQQLPSGGWYVVDQSSAIDGTPRAYWIAGQRWILWRSAGQLHAAAEACPHMGASLHGAETCDGRVVCPWHGLQLGPGSRGFRTLPTYDDGLLCWVQLVRGEDERTSSPVITTRPTAALAAVVRTEARCEPRDVIQNRLDPWHGAHFHPHSFATLRVLEQGESEITVRVAYRVLGPYAVEVDARFHCPDPRTIVMTIVQGEGKGSVVETHATPMQPGQTAIIEATLATSERRGFALARGLSPALRPVMRWAAARLWREDADYAERIYALRKGALAQNGQPRLAVVTNGQPAAAPVNLQASGRGLPCSPIDS